VSPLVESPIAAFAIVVGVVILGCAIARLLEYRDWFHNRAYYEDDPLPPPNIRSQRYEPDDESRWFIG
jgi:hypothetical protein